MKKSYADSYAKAGVDIEAGYEEVKLIKKLIDNTRTDGVLSDIGGFGGLFMPNMSDMEEPVFVSGTDGVGTKLRIAQLMNKHNTIGIDAVAMCVNDIICCGARPLFFLDYIATGKNIPEKMRDIVEGVSVGCVEAGCALIGGETAEHPGMMKEDDYDIAGFAVGCIDKKDIITQGEVKEGDALIAIASSGLHSNGFSLVRKLCDVENADLNEYIDELQDTLGNVLLTPTRIYVKAILACIKEVRLHGVSHITGGGLIENVPRMMPEDLTAKIDYSKIKVLPVFSYLQRLGNMTNLEMANTFNNGVGMVIAVAKEDSNRVIEILKENGEDAYLVGKVIKGNEGVIIYED